MRKILNFILEWFRLLLTGRSDTAVDAEIADFTGQGKDRYGN